LAAQLKGLINKLKNIFLLWLLFSLVVYGQSDVSIEINTIAQNELDSLIENREGKLLLINIWATWCIPCREEFPDLVELSQRYQNELDLVAISVDFTEDIEAKIKPFLINNKVEFHVYLNGFKKDDQLINYFSEEWNGAIPATFIYDKKGKQVKFLEGKHSFESFSSIIKELEN
jgi:thiol-disulfide isomerase/thioredoxin